MSCVEYDSSFRVEKSLGLLTTKFVHLLQSSKDGILDLNVVGVGGSVSECRRAGVVLISAHSANSAIKS